MVDSAMNLSSDCMNVAGDQGFSGQERITAGAADDIGLARGHRGKSQHGALVTSHRRTHRLPRPHGLAFRRLNVGLPPGATAHMKSRQTRVPVEVAGGSNALAG